MNAIRILLLLLVTAPAIAQTPETPLQVIEKMRGTYDNAKSYSMHITLELFGKTGDVKPVSASEGEVKKSGGNYYSSMLGRVAIVNSDYQVLTDQKQKLMIVADAHKVKSDGDVSIVDTSLYRGYKLRFLEQSAVRNRIEITMDDPESGYTSIVFEINPSDYTLTQVEYNYAVSGEESGRYQRTVIRYSNIELNKTIPESAFSEKAFFTKSKGELVVAAAYSGYRLIDQRDKNIPVIK